LILLSGLEIEGTSGEDNEDVSVSFSEVFDHIFPLEEIE